MVLNGDSRIKPTRHNLRQTDCMEQTLSPLFISGLFTIVLYAMVIATSIIKLRRAQGKESGFSLFTFAAIVVHGLFLYLLIDRSDQQNLTLFNMMSLTNWLAMIVLLVNGIRRNVTLMVAIIACFALLSSALGMSYPGEPNASLRGQWLTLLHIFSAITATGFLLLAAVQAVLLAFADMRLRSHPTHVPTYFPPLQSLESFLFQLLLIGFLLMSLSLVIATFFLPESFSNQPLHKSLLSTLAWITFGVLLVGHQWKGWRGTTAAKWTLAGFALLSLGYFGSKLVIELILH